MRYVSAGDADPALARLIETAQQEPVTIRHQQQDVAVLLSAEDYARLTRQNIDVFDRFCDLVGEEATLRGLTDEKLAELLEDD